MDSMRLSRRLLDHALDAHHPETNLGSSSAASQPRLKVTFPLGTVLVFAFIFTIGGFFSCSCYYWQKLRVGRNAASQREAAAAVQGNSPERTKASTPMERPDAPTLPVVMPGDDVPKFLAWPAPSPNA